VGHGKGLASLAASAVAALLLSGCGTAEPRNAGPSAAALAADFRGAPAPLISLYEERNRLLGGGVAAFERELRALRGHPVVINAWAHWCDNCTEEFGIFQSVAPRFARKVAFIGVDVADGNSGRGWLAGHPLSFPSYLDPAYAIDRTISPAAANYVPVTYFINRSGKLVYPKLGPYLSTSSLERDIRLYLHA
jgi:cytochrome c biogenesis protein CcmG/thiol:disulfide interchange protein DsbE